MYDSNKEAVRWVVGRELEDGVYEFLKGSHGKGKTYTKLLAEATVYRSGGVGQAAASYKALGFKKIAINCSIKED